MGPEAGARGGRVIAQGTVEEVSRDPASQIGPFLSGRASVQVRQCAGAGELFDRGRIRLETGAIHTVKPLEVEFPRGRLTAVTGVSGSGKTTLILESLIPGWRPPSRGRRSRSTSAPSRRRGSGGSSSSTPPPSGSTCAPRWPPMPTSTTSSGRSMPATRRPKPWATRRGTSPTTPADCGAPLCDGTGSISLDVQFLPDVEIPCPECRGSRYGRDAGRVRVKTRSGAAFTCPS